MPDEDAFLASLRDTFKIEAHEHLQAIAAGLLDLEKTNAPGEQRRIIEIVFRAAHSLKGAARAVNHSQVEAICQSMEDVFASWKREDAKPSPAVLDSLHRALDSASRALTAPEATKPPGAARSPELPAAPVLPPAVPVPGLPVAERSGETAFEAKESPATEAPAEPPIKWQPAPAEEAAIPPAPLSAETVRISVAKLDARLLEAEEMLTAKLITNERATELAALVAKFEEWRLEWGKIQPDARALRHMLERPETAAAAPPGLARLVDFFDWSHDYLRALENKTAGLRQTAQQDHFVIGRLVDDLLDHSKKLLMLPLATLGSLFPRLVRDLCRDQGKEADLIIRGEEVEIDKRILEEMKDPLIHLLRNCIDHGIETPAERQRRGKPTRATITLSVSPINGSKVELLVADDGAGIDVERVKASAVRHGRISAEDAARLDDNAAVDLIFQSEVSTSPIITQISGRGLGLAIVRENAEKLGGRVFVENRRPAGTAFRILLPIALATFRGIIVEVAKRTFVIPTTQVQRVVRFKEEDVKTVEDHPTLALEGKATSLVWLAEVLELPDAERPNHGIGAPAVLLGIGEQRVAFVVDKVTGEQEVLVKPFVKPLSRVRNIAGATILGSGQVAPVLNVADLLKSARKARGPVTVAAKARPESAAAKSILVTEDSITSRMLIKGILESAGYRVKTTVDGMEAFAALRAEQFDLVVSDVEMPRLNGFDLTARIRADRKLADLPVILVTALETREDRERGIDVGANAYLVKSNFDQSNLLEAVRRLL